MMYMSFKFEPIADIYTEKMIFGTYPGPYSLEKQEYYADMAHNDFWWLVLGIANVKKIPYKYKIQMIKDKRIGIWDI